MNMTGVNTLRSSKMKSTMIAVSLVLLSGIAEAKKPPKDWNGVYAGIDVGGIYNSADLNANNLAFTRPNGTCNKGTHFSSLFPGVQFGYAHQFKNKVVMGVEADFTYNFNNQGHAVCSCEVTPSVTDQFTIKNKQQASLRGRIGYALNNHLLPFVMAGGSVASLGVDYHNEAGNYYGNNNTMPGWLVGAGLEWKFATAWSLRAEYYYTAYNSYNMRIPTIYGLTDPNGNARVNLNANTVRAELNYWFK